MDFQRLPLKPTLENDTSCVKLAHKLPRSQQSANLKAKEAWKQRVAGIARAHVNSLRPFFLLDHRPLAVTIFYFPLAAMQGDIDNIVKPIIDAMIGIVYPDDRLLERILVQKFEPSMEVAFGSPSPELERAIAIDPPLLYIKIDDDLSWRQLP